MNPSELPPDFGAIPADMKMLETLINEMHGHKRGYVSEKIKHYQELLKRQDSLILSDNDVVLMQTLSELNSDLTMTSEEQWLGQPLGLLIPDILNCMDMEFLPEVMSKPGSPVMACTCLNNILEVSPETCAAIVENDGLDRIGLKLLNNDMTESIINCLEKVSLEYSNMILTSGVLDMLMNVMDFLIIQSQVTILKIVSRIFKSFSDKEDDLERKIIPILPKIKEVLTNSDKTEEVSIEIYLNLTKRIYKLYESNRDLLEQKINKVALQNNTVPFLMSLAEKSIETDNSKSLSVILNLFTIFNKFAFMSSDLSQELLSLRVDNLVLRVLAGDDHGQAQGEDSKMIMNEIISFINTLLSLNNYQNELFHRIFGLAGIEILKHYNTEKKVKFIEDHPDLIKDLLTKVVRDCSTIFESSDDFFFKYLFLTALRKIVTFLDAPTLRECIDLSHFANFVSRTLDSNDIIVAVITLFIIQGTVQKLPEIRKELTRHGIIQFLKNLTTTSTLKEFVVPEIYKKPSPAPIMTGLSPPIPSMGGLFGSSQVTKKLLANKTKDRDDFMQQLLAWQRNPKLFLENLTKMKDGDKAEIREGGQEEGQEEGEEEMDMTSSPEMTDKKPRKNTDGVQEAAEGFLEETMNEDKTENFNVERAEDGTPMSTERLPSTVLKETTSMNEEFLNLEAHFEEESPLFMPSKSQQVSMPGRNPFDRPPAPRKDIFSSAIFSSKGPSPQKEKEPTPKPAEYTISQAREDLKKLGDETLEKVGTEFSEKSEESVLLSNIRRLLETRDLKGIEELSKFFKSKYTMTFFEFSQADFIKPLLGMFLSDSNSTEDIARFLKAYYDGFYLDENFSAVQNIYTNLLDFISRLPEVTPFLSNDQLARSTFVQELKYLSTPLKIKVNFNQALASPLSKEDFITELSQEFPHLDPNTKDGLFADCQNLLRLFKEAFLKQNSLWLQVERFASLKSVEVYLVDKFTTKNLAASNDDFAKKRQKEADEKDVIKRGGDGHDNETILTSGYLEKRLEEQMNFGKEKDIRRYFEVG